MTRTQGQTQAELRVTPQAQRLIGRIVHSLGLAADTTYVVGGFVRDAILGGEPHDLDIAVADDSVQVANRLAHRLGGTVVRLGEAWGITRVVLTQGWDGWTIDVGTLRGDLLQDLTERDFTIDALAVPITTLTANPLLIDPFDGLSDLRNRLIRAVRPENFDADPLRLLRAARLAVELVFSIEPATTQAIQARARRASEPSPERCRDELIRIMQTDRAAPGLRLLDTLGLLDVLIPELIPAKGCEQPTKHYWGVFDHSIETVAALDMLFARDQPTMPQLADFRRVFWEELGWLPDLRERYKAELADGVSRLAFLKLAALLHDVAKPQTKAYDARGRLRFIGHAELGARQAQTILQRFRFSGRAIRFVATLVEEHLRPGQLSHRGAPPTRRALYRFFRDLGDAALDVLILALADLASARGPRLHPVAWRNRVRYISYVLRRRYEEESIVKPPRLVTGHDLMATFGLTPGPLIGRLLAAIEEAQGAGEVETHEEALALAQRLLARERGEAVTGGASSVTG